MATHHLFDNWFSLLVRYALIRLGINVKLRARIGDCSFDVSSEVFGRFLSRFSRGLIKVVKCVDDKLLVNDVEISNISDIIYKIETWRKIVGWRYDKKIDCWFRNNIKFKRIYEPIDEIFDDEVYKDVDVRNRFVVDVGAFVGDSAIYFASRSAKKVIAVEPQPMAYKEMLENIKLNDLENMIIPINAGLASKHSKLCIQDLDIKSTIATYYKPSDHDVHCSIPQKTLSELINEYDIGNEPILKMDCEGCEYDVILNDFSYVRVFKELIFEYHEYATKMPVKRLLEVLAKDYKCKLIRKKGIDMGIVHCVRKW